MAFAISTCVFPLIFKISLNLSLKIIIILYQKGKFLLDSQLKTDYNIYSGEFDKESPLLFLEVNAYHKCSDLGGKRNGKKELKRKRKKQSDVYCVCNVERVKPVVLFFDLLSENDAWKYALHNLNGKGN